MQKQNNDQWKCIFSALCFLVNMKPKCLSSYWLFTETLADSAETLFTKNDQEGDGVRSDDL